MNRVERQRRYEIDWLRVIAVLLLIPFHSAVVFNRYAEWYVVNETPSLALEAFAYFLSQWRMPLLFFVSGVGTLFALGFRTAGTYVKERTRRLVLPLVFGVLVIVPPQVYYRMQADPDYTNNYLRFYPTFFDGVAPAGNFEWAHLWFLAYLFDILHQTVIVVVGFYVVQWNLGIASKFATIGVASLVLTLALYEFIRRVSVLRPLFGLKPKRPRNAPGTDRIVHRR